MDRLFFLQVMIIGFPSVFFASFVVAEDVEGTGILEWDHVTGDWWGRRAELAETGVSFEASLITDYSVNVHGGADTQGDAFRHLFDANLTLESRPLLGFEGGTLFIDFQTHEGQDGSEEAGDLQAYSNIDEADFTALYELWYEQVLFDGLIRVKIGKVDANGEFAYVDHGGEFIHSSPGYSPTIFGFPTYPDPAMSFNVFVYPTEFLYVGAGVYDGAGNEGITVGRRGPSTFFARPSDLFVVGEAGATWKLADGDLPGRLGLGGWGVRGDIARFNGGTEDGTEGFYLVFDQLLWKESPGVEEDEQGVGLFAQYGWSDDAINDFEQHFGLGAAWTGPIPGRDHDVAGFMGSFVDLSDDAAAGYIHSYELALEWFYKVQVTPWFSLKPDVQYILNPGGMGLDDAVVLTLRAEVIF